MNYEYEGVLKGLGYDVKSKGFILFADLITDVRTLFSEGKTEEEVRELLPRYYLEQYHFVQEIGRSKYFEELNSFCKNKKQPKKINNDNHAIIGTVPNMGLDDSVIFFAQYFNAREAEKNTGKKLFVHAKFGEIK